MSFYELLLFLHIAAAILWVGAGFFTQLLAYRAERAEDADGLKRIADESAALGVTFFMPISLTVFVLGVLLTIDGPWGLDQLWIVLGLCGYFATFATGLLVMKPGSERVAAIMEAEGMSARALHETRKLLIQGRTDTVVLFLVVAVMAIKPTGDDVGVLLAMAAILVAGIGYVVQRVRALDEHAPQAAASAA